MSLLRPLAPLLVGLAVGACDASPPNPDPAPSSTANAAPATAASSARTAAAPAASADALKAANAKAFAKTSEQALGTLPDGVGVAVGTKAPDFELPSVEGGQVKLSKLIEDSWVLLVFYRGGW